MENEEQTQDLETREAKVEVKVAALPSEKPGDRIGRYHLLQEIGHGGFGVVYLAEQKEPVKRRVALKIIKLGMDTKQVVARFEAERQALALMDHPNIAKILEAGATQTGRPYFVMELVPGLKITDYCDQNHLSTAERLDLFMQICRAVQHAHQKGVIHRDIKPSNVLVAQQDDQHVPKVIDFGIAKATEGRLTDRTLFTAFEQFIGTPAYMSPEQAQLGCVDVDTRSDIYSLGVLLYELLTGTTPFETKQLVTAGLDEMRRTIREREPPTPSTRLKEALAAQQVQGSSKSQIDKDLDWIVMKCLEKDRARRYETANGLARDIERHLNNEPVEAGPPGAGFRLRKFVRRHKAAVGVAVAATVVMVLAVVASTWEAEQQTRLRRQAQTAQTNEARERQTAETEAARSKEVARFLEEMLKGAGPSAARGRDATMLREILDKTAERVEKDLKNQPEVQGDLNVRLALTYRDLGENQKAELILMRAVEEYRSALGSDHCKLALALAVLGSTQAYLERTALGQSNASSGLEIARRCGDKRVLAQCLYNMGNSMTFDLSSIEQVPYFREAAAIQRTLGDDPLRLANYLRSLADSLDDSNTAGETEQLFREALDLHRKHLGNEHPSVAGDLYGLAQCFLKQNKLDGARAAGAEAVEIGRRILPKEHPSLERYLTFMAGVLMVQGQGDEAESLLRRAVDESPSASSLWGALGKLQERRQEWAVATDSFSRAVDLEPSSDDLPLELAVMLLRAGRTNDYRTHCHRVLERLANTSEFRPADRAAKVSLLLPVDGADFDRACALADFAATATEPQWVLPWFAMGEALAQYRRGRYDSAKDWANRSILDRTVYPECQAAALFIKTMACCRLQDNGSATAAFSEGDEVVNRNHPDPRDFGKEAGDWVRADLLRQEAQALLDANLEANSRPK